jgi:uncharacterized protein YndB with AHSA1/START domain
MSRPAPFVIEHVFAAPRALVFATHTEPKHLERWMGAEGFEAHHSSIRFEVGGAHHYGMRGPGGAEMWGLQRYLEIVPNERLVLVQSFSNAAGELARHPMAPSWPLEMHVTETFEDTGEGSTKVTIAWCPHESDDAGHATFDGARAGMAQGFGGTFAKLEAYLVELTKA